MTRRVMMTVLCSSAAIYGQSEPPQVERVVLMPHGFEPSAISVKPGRLLLLLDNRSRLPDAAIRLSRSSAGGGTPIKDFSPGKMGRAKFREMMELQAGEYELSVPGRTGSVCKITVK